MKLSDPSRRRGGFTLIELLVATALALILMAAAVRLFSEVGTSVADSRAVLETWDRQRAASLRLQKDLEGVTVTMLPPRRPEASEGYFEIIEGPNRTESNIAVDSATGKADTTVGDFDDILMFTTRTTGKPFAGRCDSAPGKVIESDVAEVAWFVRNRTLYRRIMLVAPGAVIQPGSSSPFLANDISVRCVGGAWIPNNLSDLTKREFRYAHHTGEFSWDPQHAADFPYDARRWGYWGLPTLGDCSAAWPRIPTPRTLPTPDFWTMKPTEPITADGPRAGEDIILTNVIGFDVKVFDPSPSVGTYVDLGGPGAATFSGLEHPKSGLYDPDKPPPPSRVYDTWSLHYEHDGIRQPTARWNPTILDNTIDAGTNGFDDDNKLGVDDMGEWETMPPYPVALRGVQVKIRVFEPSSRQIREVTVEQDFLPK